jgi:DnaJ domain
MPQIIIALLIVFGGHWLIKQYGRATPQQAKSMNKKMAGGAAIAFSAFLALRGAYAYAVPLLALGLGLMGKANPFPNGFNWGKKSEGQKSRVATSILAMELDHDTQTMTGEVLAGPFKGKSLEHLGTGDLQALYQFCANATDQSASLLEAWLDRNRQEWRDTWDGKRHAQSSGTGSMSRDEAFAVLGLKSGATPQDIKDTHRRLMKEFHPDRGGSDYLAAKINQAKDILLQD